jgi:DnaJ-class molecular chaperone
MSGSQAAQPQIDFDPSVDYYGALGVQSTASADEIRRAYHRIARENHPDSTGGDKVKESRFREASAAHDVLCDADRRSLYDGIRAGGIPPWLRGAYAKSGSRSGSFDLGDLIGQFFGGESRAHDGQQPRGRRPSGRAGSRRSRQDRAMASDGTWLAVTDGDASSDVRISFDLAILGTVVEVVTIDGTARVRVPPGTSSGMRLRLRGKGPAGPADSLGGRGDHYVTVHVDVPGERDDILGILLRLIERLPKR